MKLLLIILFGMICLHACQSENRFDIEPNNHLSKEAQDSFMLDVIRYIGKLPGKANHTSKFDSTFDDYYTELANEHEIEFYFINDKKEHYFLISRIAPSLSKKHVAIGGKLKRDEAGNIKYFEEIFRTWKMPHNEMKTTAAMLFKKMLKGENLSAYQTENQKENFIIEFPSKDVQYNTDQRRWLSKNEDPMEALYKIEEQTARDLKLRAAQLP